MSGRRLYFRFLALSFRVQLRYPASLLLAAIANFLGSVIELFGMYALFRRFRVLGRGRFPRS